METASRRSEIRDNGERKKLTLFNYAPSRTSPRETDAWLSRFFSLLKSTISSPPPSSWPRLVTTLETVGKYAWERHEPRFWRRARRFCCLRLKRVLIFRKRKGQRLQCPMLVEFQINSVLLSRSCTFNISNSRNCDSRRLVPTCFLTMIDHLS